MTGSDHAGDSWSCTTGTGGSGVECSFDHHSNPGDNATCNAAGTALPIGSGAFLVGGCALLGVAVAGRGRKSATTAGYKRQPVPAGSPSHGGGSGWQGDPDGDSSRS